MAAWPTPSITRGRDLCDMVADEINTEVLAPAELGVIPAIAPGGVNTGLVSQNAAGVPAQRVYSSYFTDSQLEKLRITVREYDGRPNTESRNGEEREYQIEIQGQQRVTRLDVSAIDVPRDVMVAIQQLFPMESHWSVGSDGADLQVVDNRFAPLFSRTQAGIAGKLTGMDVNAPQVSFNSILLLTFREWAVVP